MSMQDANSLGQLLLKRGILSEEQLNEAIDTYQNVGDFFPKILENLGFITAEEVNRVVAEEYGMEVVDLASAQVEKMAIDKIKPSIARVYGVMPVNLDNDVLTVAISDPSNPQVLDDLRFIVDCELRAVLASVEGIDAAIDKYYGAELESISDVLDDIAAGSLSSGFGDKDASMTDIATLEALSKEAPVIKLLNLVLVQAIKDQASDIHFEPFENEFKIRYRIDGVLYEMTPPPKHLSLAIASRIKVMANLNIAETRLPQDGRIQLKVMGKYVDLRVSTLPTAFGESIVLRVLDQSVVNLKMEELGMSDTNLAHIRRTINKPNGIFIVTGPTGSGKTTTLYSCLREINREEIKIITAEDPVEYDVEGICQIPVKESIGLTFAACLRSILRQDPDIIFIGEIRDFETAEIAIQSSLTGHLVLSTLHTNDAVSSITRLIDMGAEPFLISSTLNMILAQRLVRKLCDKCKEEFDPGDEQLVAVGLTRDMIRGRKIYRAKGCPDCHDIGYRGRCGIFEILEISETLKQLMLERVPTMRMLQAAREEGFRTLREDGIQKIFDGVTTLDEIAREA